MPENILFIRLKSIGDILFTLPAVHVVRDRFPGAKLHFMVSGEHASMLSGFADIDEVIPLDRKIYRAGRPLPAVASTFGLLRDLRRKQFSHVIDFQGYSETEMLAWWTGAPERWGNVYQPLRGWTYTHWSRRDRRLHPADWNLSLLEQSGLDTSRVRNDFVLRPEPVDEARRFFAANGLDLSRPTLYLQPFTSNPAKNWPLEQYRSLARHWRDRGVQVIFSGGPGDKEALAPVRAEGFVVAAGAPRMTDAALMKLSTVIVGGDTGFLHLAVALGRRVVMLIRRKGPGAPVPFRHPDWIVEPPAGGMVKDVPYDRVREAVAIAFRERGWDSVSNG